MLGETKHLKAGGTNEKKLATQRRTKLTKSRSMLELFTVSITSTTTKARVVRETTYFLLLRDQLSVPERLE